MNSDNRFPNRQAYIPLSVKCPLLAMIGPHEAFDKMFAQERKRTSTLFTERFLRRYVKLSDVGQKSNSWQSSNLGIPVTVTVLKSVSR